MLRIYNCWVCKHRIIESKGSERCKAFPEGIPTYIKSEEVLHLKKLNNQIGTYTFEPNLAHKKRYETFFEKIEEIRINKEAIIKEIIDLTIDIIHETQLPNEWVKSYFEVFRESYSRYGQECNFNELHVFKKDGKILTGDIKKTSRFSILHQQILTLQNIDNQSTTLIFIVFPNQDYDLEFTTEKRNYQRMRYKEKIDLEPELAEVRKSKNRDFQRLTIEEAKEKVKKILRREKNGIAISDNLISILIEEEGYILLKTEIKDIRHQLGISDPSYRKHKK